MYFFVYRILSYFAKPNFIIYDEWFADDLEKTKLNSKNKNEKNISNIHEFFYLQSNYKVGASENHIQLDIDLNENKVLIKNYLENKLGKFSSVSNKRLKFYEKHPKSKNKLNITKTIIYSLSIIGFAFIFGFAIFFLQSKKNEARITNNSFILEKRLEFSKRNR